MYDGAPEFVIVVFALSKKRDGVMLIRLDHRVDSPGEYVGQMLDFEVLRKGLYKADHETHFLAAIIGGLGMEAVVADSAIVFSIIFSEIVEQHFPAAEACLGVGHSLHQQLSSDLLFGNGLPEHEFLELLDVFVAVVGYAIRQLSVSTGPSCLLVISLDALRDVIVDDEPHVRLVDTHSEGDCGDDYVHILHQEAVLVLRPCLRIQSGMIGKSFYSINIQQVRSLFDLFTAKAIYYS